MSYDVTKTDLIGLKDNFASFKHVLKKDKLLVRAVD